MELKQGFEVRRLLAPELRQSLNILALPLVEIKGLIEKELEDNPLLEELSLPPSLSVSRFEGPPSDFRLTLITQKDSLKDILLRQLGMFTNTDEEFRVGQEIIGNIDENGYLKATLEEIANSLNITTDKVENVLKLVQQFEPQGVGARTVSECLSIQLELSNEKDPLLRKIVEFHLEDVAKKKFKHIAKALKEPLDKIESLIKKILRLNPKPGRNYSLDEIQRIIPDITINKKDEDLEITINNEDIPALSINKDYRDILKRTDLNSRTKEFLTDKLRNAIELLRAISKRQATLRKVIETIVEIQAEAIKEDFSCLKPLTFQEVAQKINMHETTVCRVVMNKYVKMPHGIVALKDFFSSHIHDQNGKSISSYQVKRLIKDFIDQEDKKHPLSDQDIIQRLWEEKNLKLARRTVNKYREELKILSSAFRRER